MHTVEIHKLQNGKVKYFNLTLNSYLAKGKEFEEGDLSSFGEYYKNQIQDAIDDIRVKHLQGSEVVENLELAKRSAVDKIDRSSESILKEGFVFNGRRFTLDAVNRTNYHALYTASKDNNDFSTPAIDKLSKPYRFSSMAELATWFQTGLAFGNIVYHAGGELKDKVNNSMSIQELLTYVDNRTNDNMHLALAAAFSV